MEPFDDNEIGKLLRLKKFEQPPPGYFENFLHEFHRRQRDELLREPLWRICVQRARDFMLRLNVPALTSYPAAVAAVLVCAAVVSLKIYQAPDAASYRALAAASPSSGGQDRQVVAAPLSREAEWTLAAPVGAISSQPLRNANQNTRAHRAANPPRYVLDSVPVSYESNFRF